MASSVDVVSRVNGLRADFTKVSTLPHAGIRHNGGKFYKSTLTGALQKWAKKSGR